MDKQQYLQNIIDHVYCKLAPSKIHGIGVFAIRDIPKGTNPFVGSFEGEGIRFQKSELQVLPPELRKLVDDYFVPDGDTVDLPLSGLNSIDISFYMNHSKKPNVTTHDNFESFVTMRDIKKGEELTFTYEEVPFKLNSK